MDHRVKKLQYGLHSTMSAGQRRPHSRGHPTGVYSGTLQGSREGGQGGHAPPPKLSLWNFFFSEQHGICDIQSNFQHTFGVSAWGLCPRPHPGSVPVWIPQPLWWLNLFCPPLKQIPGYAPVTLPCIECCCYAQVVKSHLRRVSGTAGRVRMARPQTAE